MSGHRTAILRGAAAVLCTGVAFAVAACGDDDQATPSSGAKTSAVSAAEKRAAAQEQAAKAAKARRARRASQLPGQRVSPQSVDQTTAQNANNGSTRPFSADSPWNTRVDTLAVEAGAGDNLSSSQLIEAARERLGVCEGSCPQVTNNQGGSAAAGARVTTQPTSTGADAQNLNGIQTSRTEVNDPLFINTKKWTDPVVDAADQGVPTPVFCRQINLPPPNNDCGDGYQVRSLNIPADEDPLPQYDGWFTVLDRGAGVAYDMWRARRARDGRSISYQFLRKWSLNGPGFLPPTFPSARGSGLPLFAGLILPEEIRRGRIDHALAISVPGPAARFYVQPASVTDGNGRFESLPEGARIRLKSSVRTADLLRTKNPPKDSTGLRRRTFAGNTNLAAARAIILALRRYGAIVVDRAAVPTLYAKLNATWDDPLRRADGVFLRPNGKDKIPVQEGKDPRSHVPLLRGSEVSGLRLSDFEVVQLPPRRLDPPLNANEDVSQARLGNSAPQTVTTAPATTDAPSTANGLTTTPRSTTTP